MAQKKQQFRFRIPWLSGASASRSATESQFRRPKYPAQPDTNVPMQRPPFRPPGIAPPQPPPTHAQGTQTQTQDSVLSPSPSHITSQSRVPSACSSQAEKMSKRPAGMSGDEERSIRPMTKKLESETASEKSKAPLEAHSKFHQSKKKEKGVQKGNDTKIGQPIRKTKPELHTTASASGVHTKDSFTRACRADKKQQQEARETVERKMMFATSNPSSSRDIKVASSADPSTRIVSTSISPEKSVLSNREKVEAPQEKVIKDDISEFVHKVATVHPTQPMDDNPFRVVTLAGDNRGATMHVGSQSAKKEGSIHIHRAYKKDPEESTEVTTDGEENSKRGSDNSMDKDEVEKTFVNSNVQSINNSIMSYGSINGRDPGVHMSLPQQPAEAIMKPDNKRGLETRKAPEVNINRAEKSTYQPTVRRRCLRGLFQEPSDSDPDNPDKPRRHGCKFRCGEINKDREIF